MNKEQINESFEEYLEILYANGLGIDNNGNIVPISKPRLVLGKDNEK